VDLKRTECEIENRIHTSQGKDHWHATVKMVTHPRVPQKAGSLFWPDESLLACQEGLCSGNTHSTWTLGRGRRFMQLNSMTFHLPMWNCRWVWMKLVWLQLWPCPCKSSQ